MAAVSVYESPVGGFSFDNCRRNAVLEADFAKKGYKLPTARKTGTTIAGVVYKDGIVLGADTRATEGMVVADKNCSKIHFISPNIYCCGAGTAADTDMTTQLISSNLELHSLSTGRLPRVVTANRMLKQMLFRYQGYIGAALVLGGVDVTGPHLYSIYPHGSTDKLPYVTMGSGSLAAMAVFEDKFRPDMEEFIGRVITDRWRERNIMKILLLPGATWFSFGGLLSIFLTLSLNPVLFFSLIIFDSLQPWKYIFVYTYAVNADFFFLQKAICSCLSWSFSLWKLRCFSFHSQSQNPARPLALH
ncbi:proteasome subunit beta type-7 isoform X1 [Herpailurus yagouaroundi]|uniref:proteasome subunit beta type-7 isoform X1 n=1 Tax=Herpailurus yagouaroundi TaxID=1608482 RepID=UPI001AD6D05E|nr:proteasome subunit beta type-7 isoform X1 [Puma yagouaroundi]